MREARRRGLPDPPPPKRPEPEPEPEPEPVEPEVVPHGDPLGEEALDAEPVQDAPEEPEEPEEPEPALERPVAPAGRSWLDEPEAERASRSRLTWAEESPRPEPEDPDPPHGDPLSPPRTPVPDEPGAVPEPADPDPPHGDPLQVLRDLDFPTRLAAGANGEGAELRRDLPPLPAPTAARRPPRAPRRPRGGAPPPPPSRSPPTGRRRRRWPTRLAALAALAAVVAAIVFLVQLFQPFHGGGHGRVTVTVPRGASAGDIGDLLAQRGVVAHGSLFAIRAALAGKRGDFEAGGFTLKQDMGYGDAIDVLTGKPGAAATISVTIPEGRARRETAKALAPTPIKGDYLKASARSPRAYGGPARARTLEGFLFPATYELKRENATADRLVAEQLGAFKGAIAKVDMRAARRKNLTRYDVLTIASMVEREAGVARDRRLIAAVIYNRLARDMPLGIDATTRYALGNWDKPLSNADFARSGRYDTRRHAGLPPTPIGNPGLASLQAAANPAHVKYLYYVLKPGTCGHAFSSTDARFQRDVARYNAARKRLGGRSPAKC